MQIKLFVIPIMNCEKATAEANAFLRSHKIITVTKEFVCDGENSFYSLFVEYVQGSENESDAKKSSVDYKDILNKQDFELFSYLREVRKKIAEKDNLPIYAVLTNAQLADIAITKPKTISELTKIEGIGEGKSKKFGQEFLDSLVSYEKSKQSI